MKLKFPIIMNIDDALSVYPEEAMEVLSISFPDSRTMLCMETVRNHQSGWILEINGQFRELKPTGKRHEWLRPISFLWQFVLSEYNVTEGRSVTVGELKKLIKDLKDQFPEAPIASDFSRFLSKYDDDIVVSEDILRAWPI